VTDDVTDPASRSPTLKKQRFVSRQRRRTTKSQGNVISLWRIKSVSARTRSYSATFGRYSFVIIVHVSRYPVDLVQDLRITGNTSLLVEKQTLDLPSMKIVVQTGHFLESFSGDSLTASVMGVAKG